MNKHTSSGFTFVEIAIALVVIGLLIGGIIIGKDIVREAQLHKVVTRTAELQTAIEAFKLQYDQVPGDFTEASQYWPDCVDDANYDENTCDGDGDKRITAHYNEDLRAWQHLSLAKILPKKYSGLSYTNTINNPPTRSDYESRLPGGSLDTSYRFYYYGKHPTIPSHKPIWGKSGNFVVLSAFGSGSGSLVISDMGTPDPSDDIIVDLSYFSNQEAAVTPLEAQMIDVKMDDGDPSSGNALALSGLNIGKIRMGNPTKDVFCTLPNSGAAPTAQDFQNNPANSATYNGATSHLACRMMFYVD